MHQNSRQTNCPNCSQNDGFATGFRRPNQESRTNIVLPGHWAAANQCRYERPTSGSINVAVPYVRGLALVFEGLPDGFAFGGHC